MLSIILPAPGPSCKRALAIEILYTKCGEQFLHVRWKGAGERQTRFRYGVSEAKAGGVQRLAMEVQLIEQLSVNAFAAPVDRIAQQRVADRGHVDAHLV